MNHRRPTSQTGFSLVVSLIILTLLSVLVVSFLSSTALDRTTARAFLGKSQAEIAADTAVKQAISMLREHITEYPDSVTFWESLNAPATTGTVAVEGTMLYFNNQRPPDGYTGAASASATTQRYILPLISRADANGLPAGAMPIEQKHDVMGKASLIWKETTSNSASGVYADSTAVDLNQARFNGDNIGWIGSPAGAPGETLKAPRPYRAHWIELKEKARADGKNDSGNEPRTIGRYAFWMEDESFKVNLNKMGSLNDRSGGEWKWRDTNNKDWNLGRGTESAELGLLKPVAPADPDKNPLNLQFASLAPLQGLIRNTQAPASMDRDASANAIVKLRETFLGKRSPDLRTFNQADITATSTSGVPYRLGDEAKFLATNYSSALNLSRHGSQRLNLNGVGFDKRWDDPSVSDAALIKGLDQLVATIKYHAPKFSQRFYRTSTSTAPLFLNDDNTVALKYRDIYLYKLAANIRDYIDPDLQPTIVVVDAAAGGATTAPKIGPRSPSPFGLVPDQLDDPLNGVWAQGKDSAPYLQEAVARYRPKVTGNKWEVWIDYYMEFWNMTDRDISADELGPNPVMCISDQLGWLSSTARPLNDATETLLNKKDNTPTTPNPVGSPIEDRLRSTVVSLRNGVMNSGTLQPKGVVFKAGACTVITTDEDYNGARDVGGSSPAFSGSYKVENVYYCPLHSGPSKTNSWPRSARGYKGTLKTGETGIKPDFRNGGEDYLVEVVLMNDKGFLEFNAASIAHGGGAKTTIATASTAPPVDYWYGGTLFGNSSSSATPSQLSDPRTNNEPLVYTRFVSGASTAEPDQSRYWNTVGQPRFTLGTPNSAGGGLPYCNPHSAPGSVPWPGPIYPSSYPFPWPDYWRGWTTSTSGPVENPTGITAPMHAFNGVVTDPVTGNVTSQPGTTSGLLSIGQLGDVFDPARLKGTRGSLGIEGSRGGGRTFRIGQHDDRVDLTTANAKSMGWASWRLADFLSVSSQLDLPGVININGLMRDSFSDKNGNPIVDANGRRLGAGAALRAACYGMKLSPVARPSTGGSVASGDKTLDTEAPGQSASLVPGIQNIIDQAVKRMTQNDPAVEGYNAAKPYFGPFSERGEISELDGFSSGTSLVTGVKMDEAFDHSREELVRRIMEMITTRGSVFSVYAIGQSITEGPTPRRQRTVTGTHRVKVTFQFIPKRQNGTDFRATALPTVETETFDPASAPDVIKRYDKPHHYDVQILQVSS